MNPFVQWREQHGLSRREVALLGRLNYGQVAATEIGLVLRPNRGVLQVVEHMDGAVAAKQLESAYTAWRESEAMALSAHLK